MCNISQPRDIRHPQRRIGNAFGQDQPRAVADGSRDGLGRVEVVLPLGARLQLSHRLAPAQEQHGEQGRFRRLDAEDLGGDVPELRRTVRRRVDGPGETALARAGETE